MIRAIKFFAITLLLGFTLLSCSKDSASDETPELFINFKYNGLLYHLTNATTVNLGSKSIDAFDGTGVTLKRITLYMPINVTTGTFAITEPFDNTAYGSYFIFEADSIDLVSTSGTMTITEITDNYIKGTFSFSGLNGTTPINVTNGSFTANR